MLSQRIYAVVLSIIMCLWLLRSMEVEVVFPCLSSFFIIHYILKSFHQFVKDGLRQTSLMVPSLFQSQLTLAIKKTSFFIRFPFLLFIMLDLTLNLFSTFYLANNFLSILLVGILQAWWDKQFSRESSISKHGSSISRSFLPIECCSWSRWGGNQSRADPQ